MLNVVKNLKIVKLKPKLLKIDNLVFQLHYKCTTTLFILSTVLITSQELIGEHIKCIANFGIDERVINSFCFFSSTFTVVQYLNNSLLNAEKIAHLGIGPSDHNEPIKRHAYYQWVPYVLFTQAMFFYIPYYIWKCKEGGRIKNLVSGLEHAAFATNEPLKVSKINIDNPIPPTINSVENKFEQIKYIFVNHLLINHTWAIWLIICEILNIVNIILQVVFTNTFLGGQFFTLGIDLILRTSNSDINPLDVVFPKVTKCTFHKCGPSGTIQSHDAMCIMALNILNEKIYVFFWFWYIFLFGVTFLALLWRFVTICFHSSQNFNYFIFSIMGPCFIPHKLLAFTNKCSYLDWLFLYYLSRNMDAVVFRNLLTELSKE